MKKISIIIASLLFIFLLNNTETRAQYPGSGQVPLDPTIIPQFVDFLPHFAGLRVNAKSGGNLIIKAVQTQQVALSTGTVLDNGTVGTTPGAGVGNYFVYSISKNNGSTWTLPLWPAFTIEAKRGRALNVTVRNELYGLTYKDVNIPADQTLMMNGVPTIGDPLLDPYEGPVPMSIHLHGGEVESASDGGPYSWFTPGYALTGSGWSQGVGPILHYLNKQEASTIWYHEHSQLGLTRINVYAGMAGFYFLRGSDEENDKLPGYSEDDLVKEVTPAGKVADALHPGSYLPEIEIAIQDRMFDTNGQLYYPLDDVTNPGVHPFWAPEFFGNVITVNGKSWPYLSVAPRKYRFHFLNGSNARFYNMWLQDLATGLMGPAFKQVGTDGGLLDSPVVIDPNLGQKLLMGTGERADLVIDFTNVAPGTVLTLMNDANTPYPNGDPVDVGTTDRIMQFVVNGTMVDREHPNRVGNDRSRVPATLREKPMVKLTNFAGTVNITPSVTRQLTFNEVSSDDGPLMVLLNNSRFEPNPSTENPVEGTTEKWQLINLTIDAHPIHMHLVQFQLVSRQNFNNDPRTGGYPYMSSFAGGYVGGDGPPFPYDVPNSDGAVGGNPSITPYLLGPVMPANPNERGWKDVIIANPGQVMTYMVRFAPTDLKLNSSPNRLVYDFNPSAGPGYVWHCHIIEHEDNDMMRPLNVQANPCRVFCRDAQDIADNNGVEGFELGQNTPNPFSSETEIQFQIPEDGQVQLKLFNYLGEEVKTLIDAVAPAGNHTVRLYTENLSSGIYFYQLKAVNQIATKKLIINR